MRWTLLRAGDLGLIPEGDKGPKSKVLSLCLLKSCSLVPSLWAKHCWESWQQHTGTEEGLTPGGWCQIIAALELVCVLLTWDPGVKWCRWQGTGPCLCVLPLWEAEVSILKAVQSSFTVTNSIKSSWIACQSEFLRSSITWSRLTPSFTVPCRLHNFWTSETPNCLISLSWDRIKLQRKKVKII